MTVLRRWQILMACSVEITVAPCSRPDYLGLRWGLRFLRYLLGVQVRWESGSIADG